MTRLLDVNMRNYGRDVVHQGQGRFAITIVAAYPRQTGAEGQFDAWLAGA
ncbi:MAG: hypothetical protein H0W47_12830 [Polaromonas sp.]|nr:hypothetical protein [Polaromonas sp.]MBA3594662.1 hypothetical protein [Polaromonas sp.]